MNPVQSHLSIMRTGVPINIHAVVGNMQRVICKGNCYCTDDLLFYFSGFHWFAYAEFRRYLLVSLNPNQ